MEQGQQSYAIHGVAQTVGEVLKGAHFEIDYYQREYKWESKQISELVADLTLRFLEAYEPGHERKQVAGYPYYFLGSTLISRRSSTRYIVDGQQRLTSLTLLLMHLRRLAQTDSSAPKIDDLIYSEKYGQKSFNLDIPDRAKCMAALFEGEDYPTEGEPESVSNLVARFGDIVDALPDDVTGEALPFFMDWLTDNVQLVVITAFSDDDAYGIFETMNDRGLKLAPTDMLKGYLLANISDEAGRNEANVTWRATMRRLADIAQDAPADFLKTWLRSQYAEKIRERKRGARPEDWDRIGTEFHRWTRENAKTLGLTLGKPFQDFIDVDAAFYAAAYQRALDAARGEDPELVYVAYNADREFTLQYQLLLAPLTPNDDRATVARKMDLVARFVDIVLARRIWNNKSIAYSTLQYSMFVTMRAIRRLEVPELGQELCRRLKDMEETFGPVHQLRLHQQNRFQIHRTLARLTDYVHLQSGDQSRYREFISQGGTKYEVEHVWADHWDQHTDEFQHAYDFAQERNLLGGLLVLPKSFNASYNDLTYEQKLPHYLTQNLLARSLHPQAYDHNPGFVHFVKSSGLPFKPYDQFTSKSFAERGDLYRQIAERVWNPEDILQ